MFRTDKNELTIEEIEPYIQQHEVECMRYRKLQDYYLGRHAIVDLEDKEEPAPDNRIVNPFPRYITDMLVGYFVGQPILYSANDKDTDEDDKLLAELQDIFKYNDEQEENLELAKICSIMGKAYELLWRDEDARPRFKYMDPTEMFFIYDNSLEDNILYAIRPYQLLDELTEEYTEYVEVYDKDTVTYYKGPPGGRVQDGAPEAHHFGDVPAVLYENNREQLGDFEPVLSLIDAYDLSQSNTLNDMEQFTDAYLVLINMGGTDKRDVEQLKNDRVLLVDENGGANWLVKDVNDTWVENYKNRIKADIHKFSFTPDMADENFGSNLSGVSLRYKLLGMEQLRSIKERKFKKGLQKRIELICNFLSITNAELAYTGIDIQFNNTLPQNILETSQIISTLSPYLSTETLIEQLPFIENAKEEMEKKEAESDYSTDYDHLMALLPKEDEEEDDNEDEDDEE